MTIEEAAKNPDGTYNLLKALSCVSGISEKEIKKMAYKIFNDIQGEKLKQEQSHEKN
ncbi:MAG: hypothetical protein ACM34O_15875 [Ignavibacteria bacterium]